MAKVKLPTRVQLSKAQSGISKIKSDLMELVSRLKGTRSKLQDIKSRLNTPEQKQQYAALAKRQVALEKSTKSQADRFKVLVATSAKFKSMASALLKGTKQIAGKIWNKAKSATSWLASKLKRKPKGLKGLGDIADINDLGIAPLVIWGIIAATILALSAAVGALLSKASKLEEQIDVLNDQLDQYEQAPDEGEDENGGDDGSEAEEDTPDEGSYEDEEM